MVPQQDHEQRYDDAPLQAPTWFQRRFPMS